MLGLEELNAAQREEVCVRPGSLLQYARHLSHKRGKPNRARAAQPGDGSAPTSISTPAVVPGSSLHANTWFALNGHPFQPRFNSSVDLLGAAAPVDTPGGDSGGAAPEAQLLLPWTAEFGSFDRRWRPVWRATHRRYNRAGYVTGEPPPFSFLPYKLYY